MYLMVLVCLGLVAWQFGEEAYGGHQALKKGLQAQDLVKQAQLSRQVQMEQPRVSEPRLTLWKITKKQGNSSQLCSVISSANLVSQNTINSIQLLLSQATISSVFLIADHDDKVGTALLTENLTQYDRSAVNISLDGNFDILANVAAQCRKLVYGFGGFVLHEGMAEGIAAVLNKMGD